MTWHAFISHQIGCDKIVENDAKMTQISQIFSLTIFSEFQLMFVETRKETILRLARVRSRRKTSLSNCNEPP